MRIQACLVGAVLTLATPALAQRAPDAAALIAAQKEALKAFSMMDGVWRGPAWTDTESGRHEVTQTERIGPFLDGSVKVLEGRGYNGDGSVGFNAFGVLYYDVRTKKYALRSWAQGSTGDFAFQPTADGYVWEVPAGPNARIRYTAHITATTYHEIGERIVGDGQPVQMFDMNLKRVGDSKWPGEGTIPPR